jgi:hypothetical protein
MIKKDKGRDRWHGATPKLFNSRNHTAIRSSIKPAIVRLAVWGVIPAGLATPLIQCGGLKDA